MSPCDFSLTLPEFLKEPCPHRNIRKNSKKQMISTVPLFLKQISLLKLMTHSKPLLSEWSFIMVFVPVIVIFLKLC